MNSKEREHYNRYLEMAKNPVEDINDDTLKGNNRKSLIPLFILEIFENNRNIYFTGEHLIEMLDEHPYAINIDRRALMNDVRALMNEYPFIKQNASGFYYSKMFDSENVPAKSANSRKVLLPVFIRDILKECTDIDHHHSQQFIMKRLEAAPYNFKTTRQTLARTLNTLLGDEVYVFGNSKTGYWYDRKGYYFK